MSITAPELCNLCKLSLTQHNCVETYLPHADTYQFHSIISDCQLTVTATPPQELEPAEEKFSKCWPNPNLDTLLGLANNRVSAKSPSGAQIAAVLLTVVDCKQRC